VRTPRGCSATTPTAAASSRSPTDDPELSCTARHAQDEDPLRREEALQAHRQGQGQGPARLYEPHPREEEPQAEALQPAAGDPLRPRRAPGQEAAARGPLAPWPGSSAP